MKNNIKKLFQWVTICMTVFLLASCAEEKGHEPIGSGNKNAPGQVKNVQIQNIAGGAIFTYELPDNVDLQYVKAVYVSNKVEKETRASAYVTTLKVEGFGSTDERTVKLYAVNRMEVASAPVEAIIHPLIPSVRLVEQSLTESVDFGGFVVSFENVNKADIAIYALRKDSIENKYEEYDAMYTSLERGSFPVRGLPNKENDFGVYVVDRWNNYSDTLFFTMTPWREDNLLKSGFRYKTVQGDVGWNYHGGAPEKAWDNNVSNGNYAHTDFPAEFPHRFTMDLGVAVRLSRFKFWQRPGDDVLYQHGAPKVYRIYGRADDPGSGNPGNILEGWTLLMTCHSFKPSGLPLGQNSSEDVEFAAKGEEFTFPRDISAVRYLRFEMLESWSGMKCSTISELSFWGEIQE